MAARISIDKGKIIELCKRWNITEISLFGSVLRNDFSPKSDVDILVTFSPGVSYSLFDMVRLQDELSAIFGRNVDLVERKSIENSENYIRRRNILDSLEQIYVAR